jgi:peroxiredoxin
LAWTPVCSTQMQNYESEKKWFDNHEAHILSLSVDAVPAKLEWAKSLGGISYDLLSDFHPKGMIAEKYGVMRDDGITDRAIFVVNKKGIIVFAKVYDIPALPDNEEVRQLLGTL